MKKSILAIMLAGTVSLGACASNPNMARNAGIGGLGVAAVGAVIPGVSVTEGAIAGAAIGGLSGALWTDRTTTATSTAICRTANIMRARRRAMIPTLGRVATGALGGAALGAVAGAVIPGVSVLQGAVIGAAVGGLAGAVWTDSNNDGQVDGYMYNGQYYQGSPATTTAPVYTAPRAGERG